MLKRLFTSNTRIKLLTVFLMNPGEEYFIRELTRKLDEQINSVRRELDNLKRMGLFKTSTRNGKKYYFTNDKFIFIEELRNIIVKALSSNEALIKDLTQMGEIKLLALAGQFVEKPTTTVDLLIVGNIDKEKLAEYINTTLRTRRAVKFTVMNEQDYKYRLNCKDKFVMDLIGDTSNQIAVNRL